MESWWELWSLVIMWVHYFEMPISHIVIVNTKILIITTLNWLSQDEETYFITTSNLVPAFNYMVHMHPGTTFTHYSILNFFHSYFPLLFLCLPFWLSLKVTVMVVFALICGGTTRTLKPKDQQYSPSVSDQFTAKLPNCPINPTVWPALAHSDTLFSFLCNLT